MNREELQEKLTAEILRLTPGYFDREIGEHLEVDQGVVSRIRHGHFLTERGWIYSVYQVRRLTKLAAFLPTRDPAEKKMAARPRRPYDRKTPRKGYLTYEMRAARIALFQRIQVEILRLKGKEDYPDMAKRLFGSLGGGSKLRYLSQKLALIGRGVFTNAKNGGFLLGETKALQWLDVLKKAEAGFSMSPSQKSRLTGIVSQRFVPASWDAGTGDSLEWAAGRVREWLDAGVRIGVLTDRIVAQGCQVHYSKLSRLVNHGPRRQDRVDSYLFDAEKSAELVAALKALGEPAPEGPAIEARKPTLPNLDELYPRAMALKDKKTCREISEELGLSQGTVYNWLTGRTRAA